MAWRSKRPSGDNSTLTGAEAGSDASLLLPTDTVDAVETPPRVRSSSSMLEAFDVGARTLISAQARI